MEIEYKRVIVPAVRPFRKRVFEVPGQYGACPGLRSGALVLFDGDTVLTETPDILDHLDDLTSG